MKATQEALPLPDIALFCTPAAAALRMGVDRSTVTRWIGLGKLRTYRPLCAPTETGPGLLLRSEVDAFHAARNLIRGRA